jgi:hypothetical protein
LANSNEHSKTAGKDDEVASQTKKLARRRAPAKANPEAKDSAEGNNLTIIAGSASADEAMEGTGPSIKKRKRIVRAPATIKGRGVICLPPSTTWWSAHFISKHHQFVLLGRGGLHL